MGPGNSSGRGRAFGLNFCATAAFVQHVFEVQAEHSAAAGTFRLLLRYLNPVIAERCVRINEVQTIGSHNSYHVEPVQELIDLFLGFDPEAIFWQYTHLPLAQQFGEQGVRQIELDVFADPDGGLYADRIALSLIGQPIESGEIELELPGFKVLHVQHADFDTTCLTFVSCLIDVREWSDANPYHSPIAILIEAKDDNFFVPLLPPVIPIDAALFRALDDEIRSVFSDDRILLPDDVRGSRATLEDAVLTDGWPTLGEARGKVLFLLDNAGDKRDVYRDGADSLEGRVIFTSSFPGEPDAAFVKVNDPLGDPTLIPDLVDAGYLVRTRADGDTVQSRDDDPTQRDAAIASGAHWVSTDYADPDLRFSGYTVELPGGDVLRCNPVNRPSVCRDGFLLP
ncbi:MAG: phosphatidylinositol-specific phospholipase C1-like protein [Deltaproteobacteria bacterium]|nr:phosphatidylinositol-specific phospholipase C1-like protein [Deltaproteobacteria bacterium]